MLESSHDAIKYEVQNEAQGITDREIFKRDGCRGAVVGVERYHPAPLQEPVWSPTARSGADVAHSFFAMAPAPAKAGGII